jgi:hypothetical protein
MKNEFTPYDRALKLKQLGFDEPCFVLYKASNSNQLAYAPHGITTNSQLSQGDPNNIAAPLFQQAFRWFREKHGLVGLIEIGTQEYSFFIFNVKTDSRKVTSSINGTYEDVELACLDKLIEIVESKNK